MRTLSALSFFVSRASALIEIGLSNDQLDLDFQFQKFTKFPVPANAALRMFLSVSDEL